jgi:restriction system protein
VGSPDVQRFNGTARPIHQADVAILVTTGQPTAQATALAQRLGIVIVDRHMLARWAANGTIPFV